MMNSVQGCKQIFQIFMRIVLAYAKIQDKMANMIDVEQNVIDGLRLKRLIIIYFYFI